MVYFGEEVETTVPLVLADWDYLPTVTSGTVVCLNYFPSNYVVFVYCQECPTTAFISWDGIYTV